MAYKMFYLAAAPLAVCAALAIQRTAAILAREARVAPIGNGRVEALAMTLALLVVGGAVVRAQAAAPPPRPAVTLPMAQAAAWLRARGEVDCVDYLTTDWVSAYWLHVAELGHPRASERTEDITDRFDRRAVIGRWIDPRGAYALGIAEDFDHLPRDARIGLDVLARFGPAAVVRRRGGRDTNPLPRSRREAAGLRNPACSRRTAMIPAFLLMLLVGLSLGLLGSGGSTITLPVLVYVARIPVPQAVAMSLVIVGATAATGSYMLSRRRGFEGRTVTVFAVTGITGAFFGARLTHLVPPEVLLLLFGGVMAAAGARMLGASTGAPETGNARLARCIAAGLVLGVLTGFLGVGGGFLILPTLLLFAGLDMHRARTGVPGHHRLQRGRRPGGSVDRR